MSFLKNIYLFTLLPLFFLGSTLPAQTVSVPLSHWVYDAIERWEIRGFLDGAFTATQPFTRAEVGDYLTRVFKSYHDAPEKFSQVDVEQLRYLSLEFKEDLNDSLFAEIRTSWEPRISKLLNVPPLRPLHKWIYTNNRNLLTLQHREFRLYADPILSYTSRELYDPAVMKYDRSRLSNGVLFRGSLGDYLGFYFNLTDNHLQDGRWKNERVPFEVLQESGWPFLLRRDSGDFDFDENVASVTIKYKYFYLLYGREYNQWGIGHNGNLLLSTNAPVYDQIKFVARYWRFKLTHITAALEYISPLARESMKLAPHIDVYWAGNRLELYLGRGINLGLSEAIVYGNRSLQLGYLNPLSFFKSLEHFYGDRDNGMISLDFQWRVLPGIKLFGGLLIDDLTTGKLGTDFFGNKLGYQGGVFLVNPLSLKDLDLLLEYSRIRPYVYTQSVHDYNKYKHYDTILGHYIGPNSDDLLLRLRRRFSKFLQISLEYEKYRHGANPSGTNVGGDPDVPFEFGVDSRQAPFLAGDLYTQTTYGITLRYEFLRNLFANLSYHRFKATPSETDWQSLLNFRLSLNFGFRNEAIRSVFPVDF